MVANSFGLLVCSLFFTALAFALFFDLIFMLLNFLLMLIVVVSHIVSSRQDKMGKTL